MWGRAKKRIFFSSNSIQCVCVSGKPSPNLLPIRSYAHIALSQTPHWPKVKFNHIVHINFNLFFVCLHKFCFILSFCIWRWKSREIIIFHNISIFSNGAFKRNELKMRLRVTRKFMFIPFMMDNWQFITFSSKKSPFGRKTIIQCLLVVCRWFCGDFHIL